MVYKKQRNVIFLHRSSFKIPTLYILIGIPGSGKSYYAKKYLKPQNVVIISTDKIRKEYIEAEQYNRESNYDIFDIANLCLKDQLIMGNDVVFDATNTNKKHRKAIINLGKLYNSNIVAVVMLTPLHVCIRRNKQRDYESRVSEDVLNNYNKSNLNIDYSEGFDEIRNIEYPY